MTIKKQAWYQKAQGEIIGGIFVLAVAGLTTFIYGLSKDVNAVMEELSAVADISDIKTRITTLELKGALGGAYAQLSSDETQHYNDGKPHLVSFEMGDGVNEIDFDPRLSRVNVKAVKSGSYLLIIAPQVGFASDSLSCVDMWLRINEKDVNNSNIRLCSDNGKSYTDVMVLQSIFPLHEGDVLNVVMSVTGGTGGITSFRIPQEPLVPSIIFSLLYLGEHM